MIGRKYKPEIRQPNRAQTRTSAHGPNRRFVTESTLPTVVARRPPALADRAIRTSGAKNAIL
jgi:hypothetical protein